MRQPKLIFLLCLSAFAATNLHASDADLEAWRSAAIRKIRLENLLKVIDARFVDPDSLLITIRDEGRRRDKLAQGICFTMDMASYPPRRDITIEILDAAAMDRSERRGVGRYVCKPPG